jgi:hypothetical protein
MFQEFDPSSKEHVEWLKKLVEADVDKKVEILKKNPMKKDIPPFEIIQVVFGLSMRYTQAVFKKTAYLIQ